MQDLRGGILQVAKHVGKELTEERIEKLVAHLDFKNFEKNESVNMDDVKRDGIAMNSKAEENFIRKGKTGGWKDYFGPELNAEIDAWIEKNLKGTGLSFVTEMPENN